MDGVEGETNRRLGVLSLLYHRRRINHNKPGISAMELEQRMAFPREYLNFTLWYLRSKGYVSMMEDNSDYALTCAGVDFVETSSAKNKVIRELLTAGAGADTTPAPEPVRKARKSFRPRHPGKTIGGRVSGAHRIERRDPRGRRGRINLGLAEPGRRAALSRRSPQLRQVFPE